MKLIPESVFTAFNPESGACKDATSVGSNDDAAKSAVYNVTPPGIASLVELM